MGSAIFLFPQIDGTIVVDWNDVNLRLGYITWVINQSCSVRIRIYRTNISPTPVEDSIIQAPASDALPVPGNLRMEEYTDPEYGDTYLRWPEGLVFNLEVLP